MATDYIKRIVLGMADGKFELSIEGDNALLTDSEGNVWRIHKAHVDRLIADVMRGDSRTMADMTNSVRVQQ